MALLMSRDDSSGGGTKLEIEIRRVETHAVVALAGEVDISTVGQLYEEFADLARQGVCHVSLSMVEVTFIDSSGLSLLVAEHKRMASMKGELIIFSPSSDLRRLFQITGLDSYFNVRPEYARSSPSTQRAERRDPCCPKSFTKP
jgi:anti-anti-sigma factor